MINYNEAELRTAIQSKDTWAIVTSEYNALKTLMSQLYDERRNVAVIEHKKKLQALSQGTTVYCSSNNAAPIAYGAEMRKVSNGAKRMKVVYKEKLYMMPYSWIVEVRQSESEIQVNRRLKNLLTL